MILKLLVVLLISMIPLIELRGAIPVAIGLDLGLPEWLVLITAVIGNILPIPFIYLFARKVLAWGEHCHFRPFRQFCIFCLSRGEKAGKKLLKKAGSGGTYFALFLFVAVPIPGTGAWMGTLAASILKLDFKKTIITITAGILVAGLIMLLASLGVLKLFS
ncbi:MAG: small multi-drug export protein [Candidatus Saccharibacteria bacterium]|nr:small multi-drug export protein [Candidatus Saccharibacteria bacterium]